MRSYKKWILVVVVLLVAVAASFTISRIPTRYRLAEVTRGDIISVINSTGTIQPVKRVPVGSMVPGQVVKVFAGHNTEVKKGQVLAEIDSNPNSDHAKVISPVDGIVMDRQVEEGQTLSDRQGAVMFIVAEDLKKEVHVYASIDEADIGLIRAARLKEQPVLFTVDAYPEELFHGKIQDIRINPSVQQGVVTYNVVVSAANPEQKLLPGMTAKLSFQIDKRADVTKIPSAALRFFPKARNVRLEDRPLLEGTADDAQPEKADRTKDDRSALQRVKDRQQETRRHVWIVEGDFLRAVEVTTGMNDNTHTEMISGDLKVGQKLVAGVK
jgi:HlyD family secretion protein